MVSSILLGNNFQLASVSNRMCQWLYVSLTQTKSLWNREPEWRKCLHWVGLWASIFLNEDSCGRFQLTVGGATPGEVVLGIIRKQAEQAIGSKSVSSTSPWPRYQLLPPGSYPVWVPGPTLPQWWPVKSNCEVKINPPLPKLLFLMVFYPSNRNTK